MGLYNIISVNLFWFKPLSTFICIFCGVWWKKSEIIKLYIAFVFFIFRKSSAYKVYALQRRRLSFYRLENSGDLATVMMSRFFSRQIEFCVHFFDLSGRLKFCNHFCDKWTLFPKDQTSGSMNNLFQPPKYVRRRCIIQHFTALR